MKILVNKASDWEYKKTIHLTSLMELVAFMKENGSLILKRCGKGDYDFRIIIYDDYIE